MKTFFNTVIVSSIILFTIISESYSQPLINYKIAENPWEAGLGNHRAILQIDQPLDAAHLQLTWRRHDSKPEWKKFIIIHANSGDTIQNIYRILVNNEQCEITFGPVTKSGKYHFYYLPFEPQGGHGNYRKNYLKKELEPSEEWVSRNKLQKQNKVKKLVKAKSVSIESTTPFDSFFPMEIIALGQEKEKYLRQFKQEYHLFAEGRKYPVRMQDNIPQRWIDFPQPTSFAGEAAKNEYYAFQIALWASDRDIDNVKLEFGKLTNGNSEIPSSAFTCFNTDGVDPYGNEFSKQVDVEKGNVQPFWIGMDIPQEILAGNYQGKIIVNAGNASSQIVDVELTVGDNVLADRGDSETWRHSRLRWLNSRAGID
ncbi:MAG: hypothetical protein KAR17_09970, partial [Cyclobacteriaceae bacterium]|nr:hypothetical protein [Cyclobacteriaceae bacterium]